MEQDELARIRPARSRCRSRWPNVDINEMGVPAAARLALKQINSNLKQKSVTSDSTKTVSFLTVQENGVEEHELWWDIPKIYSVPLQLSQKKGILSKYKHSVNLTGHPTQKICSLRVTDATRRIELYKGQIDVTQKGEVRRIIGMRDDTNTKVTIDPDTYSFEITFEDLTKDVQVDEGSDETLFRIRLFIRVLSFSDEAKIGTTRINTPEMLLSENLCDIWIDCNDGVSFPAHRFVLGCSSPILNRMLASDMKEANGGRIEIHDMNGNLVKELLRFMYSGMFIVNDETTIGLYKASDKYDMMTLKQQTHDYLIDRLSTRNAIDVYALGELYQCSTLTEESLKFIKTFKNNVIKNANDFTKCKELCHSLLNKLYGQKIRRNRNRQGLE